MRFPTFRAVGRCHVVWIAILPVLAVKVLVNQVVCFSSHELPPAGHPGRDRAERADDRGCLEGLHQGLAKRLEMPWSPKWSGAGTSGDDCQEVAAFHGLGVTDR